MLLIKDILRDADQVYAERKLGEDWAKVPKAARPVIESNQVKALAEAITNAVNSELSVYKARILELERQLDK